MTVGDIWYNFGIAESARLEYKEYEACVLRELEEELSITKDMIIDLELKYVTLRRKEELRQNYYFFAKLPNGTSMELNSDEGVLKWFPIEQINELKMPFSAQFVIRHYLKTGRYDNAVYSGIANGQTVVFVELTDFDN